MKHIALICFCAVLLFASEDAQSAKAQILERIFVNISINKEIIIWSDNSELLFEFKKSGLKTTSQHEKATMIILENMPAKDIYENKTVFVLNYSLLSDIPQSFGALFWKKGRPNIVILSPRVKEQDIKVSKELSEYMEDNLW